jgi:ubiquitin-conjugating enzyme E2 Q
MKTMSTNSKNIDTDQPLSPSNDRKDSSYPLSSAAVVQDQEKSFSAQHRNDSSASSGDYLVSEHEDNDGSGLGRIATANVDCRRMTSKIDSPAEIPVEIDDVDKSNIENRCDDDNVKDDDESDYSYDYDDDDDGHYSGFIVSSDPHLNTIHDEGPAAVVPEEDALNVKQQNVIEDEDTHPKDLTSNIVQVASLEQKTAWKEPTQQAVSMSLRAEKEKSGGRRRLAADLYKVMMTDTKEAGFEVEQKEEECMDKWIVKLFNFDSDSDLHKDLLVLGLDHVELEMNFPEQVSCS